MTAADVNKDGYTDLFLAKPSAAGVFALSDGHGKFRTVSGPAASRPAIAAQLADYDNDGLLDLLILSGERLQVFRNIGGDRWPEIADAARLPSVTAAANALFQSMALGDLDRDGDTDVVIRDRGGDLQVWRNDGGNRNTSLRVRVEARVSNRSGIGAKIELRSGSLRQVLETSASSPAVAPADLVFGLGARTAADAIRVLWPSGILQAETTVPAPATGRAQTITVTELDRKPSSCPVPLHVERHAVRVRDRLHGWRRDGRLGGSGSLEPARSRRVRPHRRRSAPAARRPLRTADHERARRSAVRRSAAARRRRSSRGSRTCSRTRV